jgi:protein-S-isoprenylcysteine O-methyltransferase Ste14
MKMVDSFESSGAWLFRYRSFMPLCAVPLLAIGLFQFRYIQDDHLKTELWAVLCLLISLSGLALRVFTIGFVPKRTSGRNTRDQVAASLNTGGIYSQLRHPLYLGNYLAVLGFALFFHSAWIPIVLSGAYALYYERIMFAEEKFLGQRFGLDFDRWAATTPAFLPRCGGWVPASRDFCWRTALRREYTGLLLVAGGFAILHVLSDSLVEGKLRIDPQWAAVFIGAIVTYLVLRTLKKHTRLLRVEGR